MLNYADLLKSFEEWIRAGRGDRVREELSRLELKQVSEPQVAPLAEAARRVGLPEVALRILSPLTGTATRPETLEPDVRLAFGVALVEVGAFQWGSAVLKTLDGTSYPRALLYRAFICFNQWNSQDAIPLLNTYVRSERLTDYERMIGNLNLASALVSELRNDEAKDLLLKLVTEARIQNRQLVLGSSLELLGQMKLFSGREADAREHLIESNDILKSAFSLPSLWARKWLAIHDLLFGSRSSASIEEVRKEAAEKKDFETTRDCDLFLAKSRVDPKLAGKVYFGTPYKGYRSRIERHLGPDLFERIGREHNQPLGSGENQSSGIISFDLFEGRSLDGSLSLQFGQQSHQLLFWLASDLYKPFRIASLFGVLYPDEVFDQYTSPGRVSQAITRLRNWARDHKLELRIQDGDQRLQLGGSGLVLHYSRPIETDGFVDLEFEKLKSAFGNLEFTAKQAAAVWDMSLRGAQRRLKTYRERNLIEEFGGAKNMRFWIKP